MFCALLLLCLISLSTLAQKQPVPPQPKFLLKQINIHAKKQSFATIMKEFSLQTGCSVVIDDISLRKEADFDYEGVAKEGLDRLLETFDYSWQISKRGFLILRKRFKIPEEYPQVNLPELRQTTSAMLKALSTLPFDPNNKREWSLALRELYHTFDPLQLEGLNAGKSLHVQDLNSLQLSLLQEAVLKHGLGSLLDAWQHLAERLDGMPQSSLQTQRRETVIPDKKADGTKSFLSGTLKSLELSYLYRDREGKTKTMLLLYDDNTNALLKEKQ